jgi:hypothetical protein
VVPSKLLIYIIQWKFLKIQKPSRKFHQLTFYKLTLNNILETSINHVYFFFINFTSPKFCPRKFPTNGPLPLRRQLLHLSTKSLDFLRLWMWPKMRHKFFLDPIPQKITLMCEFVWNPYVFTDWPNYPRCNLFHFSSLLWPQMRPSCFFLQNIFILLLRNFKYFFIMDRPNFTFFLFC